MKLAIITARGGSKRIPRKNIRNFCGKPIMVYSIQAALDSGCFDEVMVSTDDQEIADLAQQSGASVPFMRSALNASDHATTAEVLLEVLNQYQSRRVFVEMACCSYPTAPFITSVSLRKGLDALLEDESIQTVIPMVKYSYPIQRALRLQENRISFFNPEYSLTRSQDLEPAYHDAGQFYWFRVPAFLKTSTLIGSYTTGIVLPEWQVQDIDTEEDWILAELKYQALQKKLLV
jgi:pseudaminic acid cytidylyltransferase